MSRNNKGKQFARQTIVDDQPDGDLLEELKPGRRFTWPGLVFRPSGIRGLAHLLTPAIGPSALPHLRLHLEGTCCICAGAAAFLRWNRSARSLNSV